MKNKYFSLEPISFCLFLGVVATPNAFAEMSQIFEDESPKTETITILGGSTAMQTASRIDGFAPLAVHFSAVGGDSGVVQPQGGDFDHLTYEWDFGDSGSGVWTVDDLSRNRATGFVAGHVFVVPGAYTVRLTVEDDLGQITHYDQQITVLDPETSEGWTTYYVAATGSDGNNGTSPDSPFGTFNHAMDQVSPNTRILFRRGDTWTASTGWINVNGPGLIGAYGSGSRPVLQFAGGRGLQFGWSTDNRDWRIIGLRFEGNGTGEAIFAEGTHLEQMLIWEVEIESWRAGIVLSANCDYLDQNVIAASRIEDIRVAWTIYMGGTRSFIQGNHLDKQSTSSSHTFRNHCANGFSASHNYFAPAHHSGMKLHGPNHGTDVFYSQNIVITDNIFEGSNWTVNLGPENGTSDQRVHNVRYERNLHLRTSNTGVSLMVWGRDITVRNNIFINNIGGDYRAVVLEQRGIEPPPVGTRIYHNTFFAEQDSSSFIPVTIRPEVSDTRVFNNLLAPTIEDFSMDGSGTGLVQGNNLATNLPDFLSPASRDLRLGTNSPALNWGVDVGVLYDYAENSRDTTPDVGAYEYAEPLFADGFESGDTTAWSASQHR